MAKGEEHPFDLNVFLNTVDGGRTVATYRKNQTVYWQGDPAESVFICVVSEQGKEGIVALHESGEFWAKGACPASPYGCRRQPAIRRRPLTNKRLDVPNKRGEVSTSRDGIGGEVSVLEGMTVILWGAGRYASVHPAAPVRHRRRLALHPGPCPGKAARAQMHGRSVLHGVVPVNWSDALPPYAP